MANTIQFKRGPDTALGSIVLAAGEPAWDTTGKTLRVGDGSTAGGIKAGPSVSHLGLQAESGQGGPDANNAVVIGNVGCRLLLDAEENSAYYSLAGKFGGSEIGIAINLGNSTAHIYHSSTSVLDLPPNHVGLLVSDGTHYRGVDLGAMYQ